METFTTCLEGNEDLQNKFGMDGHIQNKFGMNGSIHNLFGMKWKHSQLFWNEMETFTTSLE